MKSKNKNAKENTHKAFFKSMIELFIFKKVESCSHRYIVITHGTDTMIATARVLQKIPGKIIVLTGAMQPAKFQFTDAVFNIGCAFTAVQLLTEGVYIAMNGRIFKPENIQKNRYQNCFEPIF
ncbi:MAG: asparaginase domain-containing protein [Desulfobacterales bacterium]